MHWYRRRRWYHFEGNLGGLRYQARLGMFELSAVEATANQRLLDVPAGERGRRLALQVWESEGGALLQAKH